MPTQIKIDEVALLKEKLESAVSLVLADYRGLTANEMVELREKFTKEGLEYRVVKDTLARIAASEAGIEGLVELFAGPISIAFGYEDPAVAFKLSDECRKTYAPRYDLKGGVFEGVLVAEGDVIRYARLPSREELLAKLAMLLSSPMRAMAFLLQAKIREVAVLLAEVAKKREQQQEQPAAEEPPTVAEEAEASEPEEAAEPEETASAEAEPEAQEAAEQPEDQPEEESQEAPEELEEKQEEEA
jgi:large subunit ribosomal protein L10